MVTGKIPTVTPEETTGAGRHRRGPLIAAGHGVEEAGEPPLDVFLNCAARQFVEGQ